MHSECAGGGENEQAGDATANSGLTLGGARGLSFVVCVKREGSQRRLICEARLRHRLTSSQISRNQAAALPNDFLGSLSLWDGSGSLAGLRLDVLHRPHAGELKKASGTP